VAAPKTRSRKHEITLTASVTRSKAGPKGFEDIAKNNRSPRAPGASYLFDNWDQICVRVRAAKTIRLFLDFDGTLVDYRPLPNQVRLSGLARSALRNLARHPRVHTAIVSGRRRAELVHFVRVPGIELLGLYGSEDGKKGSGLSARTYAKLTRARTMLADLQLRLADVWVEEKKISLAVHFRGASAQSQRRARSFLRAAMASLRPELHVIRARDAWEVVPTLVRGKGAALRSIVERVHTPFLPIFIGDDLTDEPAFVLLRRGITVLVGDARRTKARFRLGHPGEVCAFLVRLEEEISRST
jgi:trehalose-phosphatase